MKQRRIKGKNLARMPVKVPVASLSKRTDYRVTVCISGDRRLAFVVVYIMVGHERVTMSTIEISKPKARVIAEKIAADLRVDVQDFTA